MGQPVVQFEVMGEDADKLQSFDSDLFDWKITSHGNYGIVERHVNGDGVGIAGGVGSAPNVPGHVTFYVEVSDVEAALVKAESLGGSRIMGPAKVTDAVELGLFSDPEGHMLGVIKSIADAG